MTNLIINLASKARNFASGFTIGGHTNESSKKPINFIDKYLSKPNKEGGYKLNDPEQEAKRTSDLNDLSAFQNHDDFVIRSCAANNPNCTSSHLDKALDDKNSYVRACAAKHPNCSSENISKALDDKDSSVRSYAAQHSNATKENLDKALDDAVPYVRSRAATNKNCTKEHLSKAMDDMSGYDVRRSAWQNPNYKKFFPSGH